MRYVMRKAIMAKKLEQYRILYSHSKESNEARQIDLDRILLSVNEQEMCYPIFCKKKKPHLYLYIYMYICVHEYILLS